MGLIKYLGLSNPKPKQEVQIYNVNLYRVGVITITNIDARSEKEAIELAEAAYYVTKQPDLKDTEEPKYALVDYVDDEEYLKSKWYDLNKHGEYKTMKTKT